MLAPRSIRRRSNRRATLVAGSGQAAIGISALAAALVFTLLAALALEQVGDDFAHVFALGTAAEIIVQEAQPLGSAEEASHAAIELDQVALAALPRVVRRA